MNEESATEGDAVRVLLFHPWGRFDAAFCGASHTASALLDYFQHRGWEVHCVVEEIPAWGILAVDAAEIAPRFEGVKSVRTVRLNCNLVGARQYGDEFCTLLYAAERASQSVAFRAIACEPWDAFVTTDVTAAPFAHALPRSALKLLAIGDSYARRAATCELVPNALREAEEEFAFARVEAELYHLFDRVLFTSEADAQRARRHGVATATHVPPLVSEPASPRPDHVGEHDLLICGGSRSGELADVEWFYRHVYLPHLRAHGVRLALAGPVAERFPVADLSVRKLPASADLYSSARVVVAPAHEAPGACVPVMDALAAGRAVLTTPLGMRGLDMPAEAVAVLDMRSDLAGTATAIRELLAAPDMRRAMGERAMRVAQCHSRDRHFAALDAAWKFPARTLAEAA